MSYKKYKSSLNVCRNIFNTKKYKSSLDVCRNIFNNKKTHEDVRFEECPSCQPLLCIFQTGGNAGKREAKQGGSKIGPARLRPFRLRSTVALCTCACVEIWEEVCSGVQSGTSSWLMVRKRPRPHLMVGRRLTPCVHTPALRR